MARMAGGARTEASQRRADPRTPSDETSGPAEMGTLHLWWAVLILDTQDYRSKANKGLKDWFWPCRSHRRRDNAQLCLTMTHRLFQCQGGRPLIPPPVTREPSRPALPLSQERPRMPEPHRRERV